jgi:membrane-associated phospholipid phosphatase
MLDQSPNVESLPKTTAEESSKAPTSNAGASSLSARQRLRRAIVSLPVEWIIILTVAAIDAALLSATSFRLELASTSKTIAATGVLILLFGYSRWKGAGKVCRLAHTLLVMIWFGGASSVLCYIITGALPLPRWDGTLAAVDHAFGLNWLDLYEWLNRCPACKASAYPVYTSLGPEMVLLLTGQELLGLHERAKDFVLRFMVAALITMAVGTLMPAAGAFVYYDLPIASTTGYVAHMAGLRDGSLRVIDLSHIEGLVVFPSFHAALAVLCIHAARPLRILRYPFLVLNLLIIMSSPTEGGHYFVDIAAGVILAVLTIRLVSAGGKSRSTPEIASAT